MQQMDPVQTVRKVLERGSSSGGAERRVEISVAESMPQFARIFALCVGYITQGPSHPTGYQASICCLALRKASPTSKPTHLRMVFTFFCGDSFGRSHPRLFLLNGDSFFRRHPYYSLFYQSFLLPILVSNISPPSSNSQDYASIASLSREYLIL